MYSYNKRATTTNWGKDKKQKSEPSSVDLSAVKASQQYQSFTVRGTVMEKSPEMNGAKGPFVIMTVLDKGECATLFLNAKHLDMAKEVSVGKMYDFVLYSVLVKALNSKVVGQRENFYGQSFSIMDVSIKPVVEKPGLEFVALADGLKKVPTYNKPQSYIFVTAVLVDVEGELGGEERGKLPAEARCPVCRGAVRGTPPNDAGVSMYDCSACDKSFDDYTVDWIFGNTGVVLEEGGTKIRVVLPDHVLRSLVGNPAKFYMDKGETPQLVMDETARKWSVKIVLSQYQKKDQFGYYVAECYGEISKVDSKAAVGTGLGSHLVEPSTSDAFGEEEEMFDKDPTNEDESSRRDSETGERDPEEVNLITF